MSREQSEGVVSQATHDAFAVLERADRAYHDVAQLHLHEFGGEGRVARAESALARIGLRTTPQGGRATATDSSRESADVGRFDDVLRRSETCYETGGDDE